MSVLGLGVCLFLALLYVCPPFWLSLSLSRYPSFPPLDGPSVYLSPSYVDVDRRQSGLLTLLSVSLAHLLGFLFMLVVKQLKPFMRSLSNLKFLIDTLPM